MPKEKTAAPARSRALEREQSRAPRTGLYAERRNILVWAMRIGAVGSAVATAANLFFFFQTEAWQLLVVAAGGALALVAVALANRAMRRVRLHSAGYWMLSGVTVIFAFAELAQSGLTPYLTTGGVLLILIVGFLILPRKWGVWLLNVGLFGLFIWLVNLFEPLPRYDALAFAPVRVFVLGLVSFTVLAAIGLVVHAFRFGAIHTQLLIALVLIVLLTAVAISASSAVIGFRNGRQQAIEQLELAVAFEEDKIYTWLENLQTGLDDALNEADSILFARILLKQQPTVSGVDIRRDIEERLSRYLERTQRYKYLFLLNLEGEVVASTDERQRGKIHSGEPYFQGGQEGPYVSICSPPATPMGVAVAQPVLDSDGSRLGIFVGYVSLESLEEIMHKQIGIGERVKSYLVGSNHDMLSEPYLTSVRTEGVNAALETRKDGHGLYEDYDGEPVVGVYHWLPELQAALVAEQDQAEAFKAIYSTLVIDLSVALVSVLFAVGVSLFITRSIANPLAELAETATQIAAGNLERVATVKRTGEVGMLGRAFNSMTAQLRELISSLEQRVAERTQELERHSDYLEASAEVARAASSILDADQLIQQTVGLIRERFDLYYVGLFLVDGAGEWVTLRAGTGEAGRAMLARGHRLEVGEGMIGWSVANAEARIALDIGEDAVHLATAELPDTRSEAALPMRSRGRVIGALTIQSDKPAAFDKATIAVLQAMADQVAVALDNARLFTEAQEALEAERQAYGELSREAWGKLLRAQAGLSYRSGEQGVASADEAWRPEMEQALREGKVVQGDGADADGRLPLALPIEVRGSVIGVLDTYKPAGQGAWTAEEISLLETLIDQLEMALESTRLYQDTQRRAVREQMLSEMTGRFSRSLDLDAVLQTAVRELGQLPNVAEASIHIGAPSAPPPKEKREETETEAS